MGSRVDGFYMLFLICFCLISDSSTAEKPPFKAILQNKKLSNQEEQKTRFSHSAFTTQRQDIPIVNPTTPSINQPPPTTTQPTTPAIIPANPPPPTTTTTTPTPTPASSGGSWCVSNPTASETALQVALDYACGYGGADCSAIQPGATCYNPNTVRDHASYAFNDYYQKNPIPTSCVFGGTAMLTSTDPSSGTCRYASPTATPTTQTVPAPTPPSISSPINPYTPTEPTGYGSEPTDYGAEPTGTPNSADSISSNLQLLLKMTCLMVTLIAANYL